MQELWRRSAGELARLVATKDVSSAEVVEAHLARIEAVNPQLNAVVRVLADEARTAAAQADRLVAAGGRLTSETCTQRPRVVAQLDPVDPSAGTMQSGGPDRHP